MSCSSALLRYGGESIPYDLVSSPRRKTLGIEVYPDLSVVVRVPLGYSEEEVRARVQRRAQWINRQRSSFQRYMPRTPPRHYVAGESHMYLGRHYRLKLAAGEKDFVVIRDGSLLVSSPRFLSPWRVQELLTNWYRQRAHILFLATLDKCFGYFSRRGYLQPSITVRNMERRWGSLSEYGRMTLNINLVKASKTCIEYVVMHELCHLQHKSHSEAFFQCLEKLMPDWERRKRRLEMALL